MPDIAAFLTGSGQSLGGWAYLLVGVLAYLETAALVGLLVPGELAVVVGGGLAATGAIDVTAAVLVVWAAAVGGDLTGYLIGRRLGEGRLGARIEDARPAEVARVRRVVERHGVAAVIGGRFVGVLRAFTPLVAGSVGMPVRRFLIADVLGAGVWAAFFTLLGYAFWDNLERILGTLHDAQLAVGAVVAVAVVGVFGLSRRARSARAATSPRPPAPPPRESRSAE